MFKDVMLQKGLNTLIKTC